MFLRLFACACKPVTPLLLLLLLILLVFLLALLLVLLLVVLPVLHVGSQNYLFYQEGGQPGMGVHPLVLRIFPAPHAGETASDEE